MSSKDSGKPGKLHQDFDPWSVSMEETWRLCEETGDIGFFCKKRAVLDLLNLRKKIESGDGVAVLEAVNICAMHQLVAPEWLADPFSERVMEAFDLDVASWDAAFGRPYAGRHISGIKKRLDIGPEVYFAIRDIISNDPERAVDKNLFEEVGQQLGIGATLIEKVYREQNIICKTTTAEIKDSARAIRQLYAEADEYQRALKQELGPEKYEEHLETVRQKMIELIESRNPAK